LGRAKRLANAGSPDALIDAICEALHVALAVGEVRIGFDWKGTVISTWRTTFQFRVDERLYDWFFNARTGYRAHFWVGCEAGLDFNAKMISRLRGIIERHLTGPNVKGHKVRVEGDRKDVSEGMMWLCRSEVLASLDPGQAKFGYANACCLKARPRARRAKFARFATDADWTFRDGPERERRVERATHGSISRLAFSARTARLISASDPTIVRGESTAVVGRSPTPGQSSGSNGRVTPPLVRLARDT
jgi:hypothetical protein